MLSRSREDRLFPKGCETVGVLLIALGAIIGGKIGGGEPLWACVGALVGIAAAAIVGYLLSRLFTGVLKLKPATKEETAVSQAVVAAATTLLLCLAAAAILATNFIEQGSIVDAVGRAAERQPGGKWISIAIGTVIGLVLGYRIIRAAFQRVPGESATTSERTDMRSL